MSRKQLVTLVGAACSSLLLAACFPELPDSVPYPDSGSVPVTERQTLEAFVSGTMPRYMSIIEEVAMESGGVIADVGHSESWACRSAVNGYEISAVRFNIPLIDYEDLRRIVGDAAQRYGYSYSTDPVPRDKENMRSVGLGDQDGNSLIFDHFEDDVIFVQFSSGCLPSLRSRDIYGQFAIPSAQEMFPRLTVVDAYDADKQRNPLIFRQVATDSDKKSGS